MNRAEKNEQTKYRLAEAIKECMKHSPAEEITVKEIVSQCGVTRQTFYRHFRDRSDLINWYFDRLLEESFREMGSGDTVYDGLVRKFEYIRKEQVFFRAAFSSDEQNNLKEHDFQRIVAFYKDLIQRKTGIPADNEITELLEMYCSASIWKTVDWVIRGMDKSERELASVMVNAMPAKLEALFNKLNLLK